MLCLAMLVAGAAFAQSQSGNIFGRVVDNQGAALPGVTVTLSGPGASQVFVTDSEGQFRFLSLSPGAYTVAAELSGFGSVVQSGVVVNVGRNTNATLELTPALEQTITVTAETPLLDVRKTGTGATVTSVELEEVPTARDPWVILQQVPGVLMDRINVGGSESGQQSQFATKGSGFDQATWNVDGVNTTDMIATGGSSDYYDFGSFEEFQVSTGGTDPRVLSPGAQINIVTKRGTNEYSGSARYYKTDGDWQGSLQIPSEATAYLGSPNQVDEVTEWGADVGGPVIRDRVWLWAAYADQQIDLFVASAAGATPVSDKTTLVTWNFKGNAQITASNSAVATYSDNDKIKLGRNVSLARPQSAGWNQSGFGPAGIWKAEDTHIFSPNFYMTGLVSRVNGGFQLQPDMGAGCTSLQCAWDTGKTATLTVKPGTNTWDGYFGVQGIRPQNQYRLDSSAFFDTGNLNHELKFGFGYRKAAAAGLTHWPQDRYVIDWTGESGMSPGLMITYFTAFTPYDYQYEYQDLYVGDTMLMGDLTLQVGFRYDKQEGSANDQIAPSNAQSPLLPGYTVPGSSVDTIEWTSILPRIGATYAIGESKRTLVRAAYNVYADQLGGNSSGYGAVFPGYYRYVSYWGIDEDGNGYLTQDEFFTETDPDFLFYGYTYAAADYAGIYAYNGFDPDNPTGVATATSRVDPGVDAPETDEYLIGIEHELLPGFTVGATYSHRKYNDQLWFRPEKTQGGNDFYTSADYVLVGNLEPPDTLNVPGLADYSVPYYTLAPGVGRPIYSVLSNRPGYSQNYDGLDLTVVKRMANRWMLRGNFTWSDWTQDVSSAGIIDPTPLRTGYGCSTCDGATVVEGSGTISGAKGAVWVNSEWAYVLTGVYQIPVIEANFGVNLNVRQGFPIVYGHSIDADGGGAAGPEAAKVILVQGVDDARNEDVMQLDLRLSKDFQVGPVGLELSVNCFNVTNENAVLQRNADLVNTTSQLPNTAANRVYELQSPQVYQVGARISF